MKEDRGILKRIGAREGDMIVNTRANDSVGYVRVSGSLSVVEMGDTVLRDVGSCHELHERRRQCASAAARLNPVAGALQTRKEQPI